MTGQHFDESVIIGYLEHELRGDERSEFERHISECDECRDAVDSFREFVDQLNDDGVWRREEPMVMSGEKAPHARELAALAASIEEEVREIDEVVRSLYDQPVDVWRNHLARELQLPSAGLINRLLAASRDLLEARPSLALSLAELATSAAVRLEGYPETTSNQLLGHAWKQVANAQRHLGSLNDALAALSRARVAYQRNAASAYDIACVDYVEATVLRMQEKNEDSLRLLDRAQEVFLDFGDARRQAHTDFVRGCVQFSLRDYSGARDTFLALLRPVQQQGDAVMLARIYHNAGEACVQVDDHETAATYFLQAMRIYDEVGMPTEKVRARWCLARVLMRKGQLDEASERLRQVGDEFEASGMFLDAALAWLDLVELQLARNDSSEAVALCRVLIERFTRASVPSGTATALAYLREALDAGDGAGAVKHVRTYVERLPREPQLLFLPPPQ